MPKIIRFELTLTEEDSIEFLFEGIQSTLRQCLKRHYFLADAASNLRADDRTSAKKMIGDLHTSLQDVIAIEQALEVFRVKYLDAKTEHHEKQVPA